MKYLFLVAFVFNLVYMRAQFVPMLDVDHSWSIDLVSEPFGGGTPSIYTLQVSLTGTTMYNGVSYFVVSNQDGETGCFLREENGVVYRYNVDTNEESIMYDFSLEVGDTFTFDEIAKQNTYCGHDGFNNTFTPTAEVIEVSTEFIANRNRKVIRFVVAGIEEVWVEGIGSLNGFDPISATVDIYNETNLVCFTENTTTWFFNNANSCDNTFLSVLDIETKKSVLYPNPVKDKSILQIDAAIGATSVTIYNAAGKIIDTKFISNNTVTISAMQYAAGCYFYEIQNEKNTIAIEKFIVQ